MERIKFESVISGLFEEALGLTPQTVSEKPTAASSPPADPAEVKRKSQFQYYSNQAYWDMKAFGRVDVTLQSSKSSGETTFYYNPLHVAQKMEWFEKFQGNLFQLGSYGKDSQESDEERAWLCRRLYAECIRSLEARIANGTVVSYDLKELLQKDPDLQIAGTIYSKTHFKNKTRWSDDLDSLRAKLEEKAQTESPQLLKNGLSEIWRGDFNEGYEHWEKGLRYFFNNL
jgi:hypothetical protein